VRRFLVTGATGFIGSAVTRRLEARGEHVVALGSREIDLLAANDAQLESLVDRAKISHCIHCAWYTNHSDYLVHDINREWFTASLRLARACRRIRFVGLGTCLEYDFSDGEPCVEDRTPLNPDTLYARSKAAVFDGLGVLGGNFIWARVFFVYGPGDRPGRLVPAMMDRFGRGEQAGPSCGGLRRDYIHVDDLAGQLVRLAASDVRGAVNTGTGMAPTLSSIFAAGAQALGRPELACTNRKTGGQPPLIQADMTRFRERVGDPEARNIARGLEDLIR